MATADIREVDEEILERHKPPFLRRVRIRGYKSIAFCDVTLEPLTVLVGKNNSGKSNFLDALAFLRDVVNISVAEALKRHGGWSSIKCRTTGTARLEFEVEVGVRATDIGQTSDSNQIGNHQVESVHSGINSATQYSVANYMLVISGGEHSAPVIEDESLGIIDKAREDNRGFKMHRRISPERSQVKLDFINCPTPATHVSNKKRGELIRVDQTVLGATVVDESFVYLADAIRNMGFQNLDPNAIRSLVKPTSGSLMEKDASNLASIVRSLNDIDPVTLNRVKQYVCHIVEEVSDFWVQSYGEYETIRFRMRSSAGGKPLEFDAASMSDGTLRVLASVMAVFQNVPPYGRPSVVGIEEPETALHPRAIHALVDALDEATLRTQVLLTTHSTELLNNPTIQPKNVRVVEMVDGQTIIGPVDEAAVEVVQRKWNTLGGLERDNRLEADLDDRERQELLQKNGQEPHQ